MVRIVTDSAADFEPQELARLNVACIPLRVRIDEIDYEENLNLGKDQFYRLLAGSEQLPKTSQAPPQVLLDLIEQAQAAGEPIIYITLSSALSGTYQSALAARELTGYEQCYIVDSKNATGGQRILVEQAAKLRDEGKTASQIVEAVEALRSRIVLYACIDTLEYLYKGGRINRAVYTIGSVAQIKPIIRVNADGGLDVPGKAMGMRRGMDTLQKKAEQLPPDAAYPFYVMYTDSREVGRTLAQLLTDRGCPVPEERIIQVGAAIGTHIGPNACGLVYVCE